MPDDGETVRGESVTASGSGEEGDGGGLLTMIVALVALAIAAGVTDRDNSR